jgi:ADP-ribose pyrophosphatase YjhB (NUDIX family)
MKPSIAVKEFVVNDGKLLLIKRRGNDVYCAEKWETPGGRLDKIETLSEPNYLL